MEPFLRQLAEMLVRIHQVSPKAARLSKYRTYVDLQRSPIPPWLRARQVWQEALAAVREAPKSAGDCFIHRDYHPENSLWSRGRLTGIVDWTQASIGSPEVDVGHMRWNLVATYGQSVADRFQNLYEIVIGRDLPGQPQWDLITLLDLVLDVADPIPPTDLARFEAHAAVALARLC